MPRISWADKETPRRDPAGCLLAGVYWKERESYFTPIQPEMTIRWTSEVPS